MSRYAYADADPSVRNILNCRNADELKRLATFLPGFTMKAPRKGELIEALARFLLEDRVVQLWAQLTALEQSAVAEAVHSTDGAFDPDAFHAKYGALPDFDQGKDRWLRHPTRLGLFILPEPRGGRAVPPDVRERLRAFVPTPPAAELTSLESLPENPPREWTSHRFDSDKQDTVYKKHEAPLMVRLTEPAALQDLRTVLRLIDQEKISVSSKTSLPSKATMALLDDLLHERDFFPIAAKVNSWDPEIGPVKGFSWPLLVQAAKLAALRSEKLLLTKSGRAALADTPAQTLRNLWNAWVTNGIFDEFSRIDTIKGQKRSGRRCFTPPPTRRRAIQGALAACPVGRWVEFGEFSRYMQAGGFRFEVTADPSSLYICDPEYGHLGYDGYGGWNILQERYLLCLLFEYAAPLGIIDLAYENPVQARDDFRGQWGTDDLIFLSRYDGLRYFRLTPLGQFILGQANHYERPEQRPAVSLTVLPNRQIRLDQGDLSPDEKLLLTSFAEPQSEGLWVLDEARAIRSVEKGSRIAELRTFLSAGDPQPLPEAVEGFLAAVEKRGAACVCKGTALLIECVSAEIAELLARNPETSKLCQRAGERGLVVPVEKEKPFRAALNAIGYGMPQV